MDLHLKDHVAIITGGASGIGLAAAKAFAAEGAHVAIWDLSQHTGEMAAEIRTQYAVESVAITVDVTDEQTTRSALLQTQQIFQSIDHLVHAAAIGSGKFGFPFTNLQAADWRKVLEVNVMGMVNVAHAVAPTMIGRAQGSMVFLASVAGQIGSQTDPPYSASKAANINFAQCLAKDLAPHGVRVNSVCPGMAQTPLNRSVWLAWHDQTPPAERLSYEEWAGRKIKSIVPLGKWQTPEAIADMVVFLSSDRAEHVTGQTINVDGGFVMHW
jgi:2-hydroxycyclohexanecarboxyl-CoA dehydrogenase